MPANEEALRLLRSCRHIRMGNGFDPNADSIAVTLNGKNELLRMDGEGGRVACFSKQHDRFVGVVELIPLNGRSTEEFSRQVGDHNWPHGLPVSLVEDFRSAPVRYEELFPDVPRKRFSGMMRSIGAARISLLRQKDENQAGSFHGPIFDDVEAEFDPHNLEDARERQMRAIAVRRGQQEFRRSLINAYAGCCAISGCNAEAALEAAHIMPYRGKHTNHVTNGLLLRADIHTLFDLGLISIKPDEMTVAVANALLFTLYAEFEGRPVRRPEKPQHHPDVRALQQHFSESKVEASVAPAIA